MTEKRPRPDPPRLTEQEASRVYTAADLQLLHDDYDAGIPPSCPHCLSIVTVKAAGTAGNSRSKWFSCPGCRCHGWHAVPNEAHA